MDVSSMPADLGPLGMGSPMFTGILVLASFLIGAVLLMAVVRWTEGFAITFWQSSLLTIVSVVAVMLCQALVFALLLLLGVPVVGVYWLGLAISLALSIVVYTIVYAYGVKRPTGEPIGLSRAIKVTVVQLGLSFVIFFVLAVIVAILAMVGVVPMPQMPQ